MTFSYLSRKELTRSLVVSKHWRSAILGSVVLRRKLLLDLDPRNEYYSYSREGSRMSTFLSNKQSSQRVNRLIHEPHPVLLPYSRSDLLIDLEIVDTPYEVLRSVHPATFLFHPPLNNIQLYCAGYMVGLVLEREGGVTFGELLEELDKMRKLRLWWDGGPGDVCKLRHAGVIASNAKVVVDAREARAKAEASAGLEGLE